MALITREDGEHFIVPTYRDVLVKKRDLKEEILQLAERYGEYVYLHQRNAQQYDVAFSRDPGYLLGETIWYRFKRPTDFLYCELLPDATEAILVVVTAGTVYLEGSFPVDSIPEELVVFTTQKNRFDVYVYGDVPVVKDPEPGKFAVPPEALKSFTLLDEPAFQRMPTVRALQVQVVEAALRANRIGVLPIRQVVTWIAVVLAVWGGYSFITEQKAAAPVVQQQQQQVIVDPYKAYYDALNSPNPHDLIGSMVNLLSLANAIPGWTPLAANYMGGYVNVPMQSQGAKIATLVDWANMYGATLVVAPTGLSLNFRTPLGNRQKPDNIYPVDNVIIALTDRLSYILPDKNVIRIETIMSKGAYRSSSLKIEFSQLSPVVFDLIGRMLEDLPVVVTRLTLVVHAAEFSGSINVDVLGK